MQDAPSLSASGRWPLSWGGFANPVRAACGRAEGGQVQIANWNSPEQQIVISGHKAAVEDVVHRNVRSVKSVMLPVSAPFHSGGS